MISQASSENNICFVINENEAPRVLTALRQALEIELMRGHIEEIAAEQSVAIVAAVGDRMRGTPGIAATVFTALGSAGSEVIPAGDTTYTMPIVVVWDRSGAVVAQAQGMASSDELERVVSGVLAQGR